MNAVAQIKQTGKAPSVENAAMRQVRQQCITSGAVNVQIHGSLACIAISGRFDFQLWRNFKDAYMPLLDNVSVREIQVEMSRINFMDSSAMGMLLLLNERAGAINKTVMLLNTSGFVSQILKVANFGKIFNIKHVEPGNGGSSGLSDYHE